LVRIRKNSPRPGRRSPYFYEESSLPGRHSFQDRWNDVRAIADLRLTDRVLDVGCAEGLIALEVAKTVDSAAGFDVSRDRVAEANRMAAERGTRNAIFEVASVDDYSLKPLSYDVVLFLALWGKNLRNGKAIGAEHLDRLLAATRRQMIMRVAIQNEPHREGTLEQILTICEERIRCALLQLDATEEQERRSLAQQHHRRESSRDRRPGRQAPEACSDTNCLTRRSSYRRSCFDGG
jgi:SAM-dependent methyltransferase